MTEAILTEITYLQFRAENCPLPVVRSKEQLGEIIEDRVKPGLDILHAAPPENSEISARIAYVGYALAQYLHPLQRLDFRYFDPNDPRRTRQDFYLRQEHCFDLALARRTLEPWKQHKSKQADFQENGYILGPVIRAEADPLHLRGDEYNQDENLAFSTRHAVFIPGEMLLSGMYAANPQLREGFAVYSDMPYEYLATTFDLQPKINHVK